MPTDVRLRTTEKNSCYRVVEQSGFDPADFRWSEQTHDEYLHGNYETFRVSVLTHKPTGYFVLFGGFGVSISPGPEQRVQHYENGKETGDQLCQLWLQELREEVDAPDLWASVAEERVLSDAAATSADNRPFTESEQTLIARQLRELQSHVLEGQTLQVKQLEFIEERFMYLTAASERIGRKDWLILALGTFVTIIVGAAFAPDQAKALLGMAGTLFKWVWAGASTLLP
jgi:hypothetical protein